jgi:hypothetical protein
MGAKVGSIDYRQTIKPVLSQAEFIQVMTEGAAKPHDGTNLSNEIGLWRLPDGRMVIQKVMLTAIKYHQRRKALTEMVHVLLDEGLGSGRVTADTYAETFEPTDTYISHWGDKPKDPTRQRVVHIVHDYLPGIPGDEWRGAAYRQLGDLNRADTYCRGVIEAHVDAERIALLDFLTINQDRSARNWLAELFGRRFWAIDNGMAWFHEYPNSDEWKIGTVIDDVLLQTKPWQFISGVFTTSYAGRQLSLGLLEATRSFDWPKFDDSLDLACDWLGLPSLSLDWRLLGLKRRFGFILLHKRFPTADEYRSWLQGSDLMTPDEIVETGGQLIWRRDDDRL